MHRSNTEQKTYLLKKLYKFSPVNVYHATYLLTNVFCIIIPFIFCIIISIFAFVVSAFMAISGLEKSKNVFLLFLFLFFQNIILSLFSYHERETPRPECTLVSHLYEREQLFCLVKREKKYLSVEWKLKVNKQLENCPEPAHCGQAAIFVKGILTCLGKIDN